MFISFRAGITKSEKFLTMTFDVVMVVVVVVVVSVTATVVVDFFFKPSVDCFLLKIIWDRRSRRCYVCMCIFLHAQVCIFCFVQPKIRFGQIYIYTKCLVQLQCNVIRVLDNFASMSLSSPLFIIVFFSSPFSYDKFFLI